MPRLGGWITVIATVVVSIVLVSIPSDTLIRYLGTENGYVFMYLIALVGSITTFASIPYPLFLISLAAGGFSPLLIGLTSALGVITADSITFFVARKGRALFGESLEASITKIGVHIERHPHLLTPGLMLYGTLSPLSNDFAVMTLSLMKYRYLEVIPPLAVGNIIYNVAIAYLGIYAYNWIVGLF